MRRHIPTIAAVIAGITVITANPASVAEAPPAVTTVPPTTTTQPPAVNYRSRMETGVSVPAATSTTIPAGDWRYPTWIALAVQVGWPNDPQVLATLDLVLNRESHGRPEAWNRSDPHGGSFGLTQVNGFWCKPTKYHPAGFMQQQGIGVTDCTDLFDPATNLRAALVIFTRQNGFGAWSTV